MTPTPETTQRPSALQALLDALTAERFGRLPHDSTDEDREDAP